MKTFTNSYSTLKFPFKDGAEFVSFSDESSFEAGTCGTCDFGSEYINNICVQTTHNRLKVSFNAMYEFAFTTAEAIRIFCAVNTRDMTEREFLAYLVESFQYFTSLDTLSIDGRDSDLA